MSPLRLLLALPSWAAASLPPGLSTGPSRCAAAAVVEVREVLAAPRSARPSTPPSAVVVGLEALAAVALGVSSSLIVSSSPQQLRVHVSRWWRAGAEALGTDRWLWAPSARAPQGSSPLPEFPRPYSTACFPVKPGTTVAKTCCN